MVVIAILGVLLMSAIATARERGDEAQCMANLRNLAQANLAYAADNGTYVPAQEKTNRVRWHGVRSNAGARFDPRRGPLSTYLGSDGRVKTCPTFHDALSGADSFEDGTGGYGYNAAYIGGTAGRPFQAERAANVPNPARTVMFTDTAFARAAGIQEYAYAEPYRWVDFTGQPAGELAASVHFRHRGRANVAWCDGHVTPEAPTQLDGGNRYGGEASKYKIGWFGPEIGNGYWNPLARLEEIENPVLGSTGSSGNSLSGGTASYGVDGAAPETPPSGGASTLPGDEGAEDGSVEPAAGFAGSER
jgi:prepilin-type processing-associated H-X9-DG protein